MSTIYFVMPVILKFILKTVEYVVIKLGYVYPKNRQLTERHTCWFQKPDSLGSNPRLPTKIISGRI